MTLALVIGGACLAMATGILLLFCNRNQPLLPPLTERDDYIVRVHTEPSQDFLNHCATAGVTDTPIWDATVREHADFAMWDAEMEGEQA